MNCVCAECDEQRFTTARAQAALACLAFFPQLNALSPFLFLSPSHSWSVSSHCLCLWCFLLLCLCQTSTLHSPSSLKPTPWQPVAASPRKVDNLRAVPQQPGATSDREASYIINQKQPRGAVEDGIGEVRERRSDRKGGVLVPNCWLLQYKLQRGNSTSSFDWTCMSIHMSTE